MFTKTEKAKVAIAISAALVGLTIFVSLLFGADAKNILPGVDGYNTATKSFEKSEAVNVSRLTASRVNVVKDGVLPAGSTLYAVHSAFQLSLGENKGTAMISKSHFNLTKEECEMNSSCSLSNGYKTTSVNLQVGEAFDYDAYTYTAFWYRWYQTEDGSWTTEPLFREGLSYIDCVASQYCNPDLSQGRNPIVG